MSQLLKQPSSKFILRCPLRIARSTLGFRMVIHCPKQMRTQYATGRSSHECGLGRSSCWETPVDVTVDCGSNIVVILTPEIGEDGPRFIHVFQKGEGWLEFVSTNKLFLVSHQNSDSKNWWKLISVCASLKFWKSISLQLAQNLSRILRQIWFSAAYHSFLIEIVSVPWFRSKAQKDLKGQTPMSLLASWLWPLWILWDFWCSYSCSPTLQSTFQCFM